MGNHFLLTIPVYNAEKYVKRCIDSVKSQTYKNFKAVIVDDCSTDKTYDVICENIDERFVVVKNEVNMKALRNHDYAIDEYGNENDIVVNIDGDDWLYNKHVFEKINNIYDDEDIWLTYGTLLFENGMFFPQSRLESASMCRLLPWKTSHLRTFRRKLYKHIKKEDFVDNQTGKYFHITADLAIMFPMIEMAGDNRIKFVEQILYCYNRQTELNDDKIDLSGQERVANFLRNQKPYNLLQKL